jgi:hypothetical protein
LLSVAGFPVPVFPVTFLTVAVYSVSLDHILKFITVLLTFNLPGNKNLLRGTQLNIPKITQKKRKERNFVVFAAI